MAKLTKAQTGAHERACRIMERDGPLHRDDVVYVVENWHEGAAHANTRASAHFTPFDLAMHAALEVTGPRVLDLCAGIGTLSVAIDVMHEEESELTLVEINPDYAEVARRLLPRAEVITGSMYDAGLMAELAARRFDVCVSNPPFGNFSRSSGDRAPRFTGSDAHYDAMDIASDVADLGVFIVPQTAVPFRCSGSSSLRWLAPGENPRYERFSHQTGIEIGANIGIDTTVVEGFRDVRIVTEIATMDFRKARARRAIKGGPLLAAMAA